MNTEQLRQFLIDNQKQTRAWLVKETGRSSRTINEHQAKLRAEGLIEVSSGVGVTKPILTDEQQFALDMEKLKLSFANKQTDQKYKVMMKELLRLREMYEDVLGCKDSISTYQILPSKNTKSEAVAFAIASDWHVDERVTLEQVDGSNEYNMAIAKRRAEKFFQSTLKLVTKEQAEVTINKLVLALIGDFISGHIHPELMETTEVSPQDAMLYAMNLIASGIEYLLANSKLEIIVPCCVGNHARDTIKSNIATEHGNNKEWAMYHFLQMYFKNNKRVSFIIPRSQFTYLEIFGKKIRFIHGHMGYKYAGGIGGISVSLNKAVMRWNESNKADLTVLGHWHQRQTSPLWVINGSLIGDAPYGKVLGFSGKPEQAFFLWDKNHGKTVECPIFVI